MYAKFHPKLLFPTDGREGIEWKLDTCLSVPFLQSNYDLTIAPSHTFIQAAFIKYHQILVTVSPFTVRHMNSNSSPLSLTLVTMLCFASHTLSLLLYRSIHLFPAGILTDKITQHFCSIILKNEAENHS